MPSLTSFPCHLLVLQSTENDSIAIHARSPGLMGNMVQLLSSWPHDKPLSPSSAELLDHVLAQPPRQYGTSMTSPCLLAAQGPSMVCCFIPPRQLGMLTTPRYLLAAWAPGSCAGSSPMTTQNINDTHPVSWQSVTPGWYAGSCPDDNSEHKRHAPIPPAAWPWEVCRLMPDNNSEHQRQKAPEPWTRLVKGIEPPRTRDLNLFCPCFSLS